jgi:iron transport multicopper oxidase
MDGVAMVSQCSTPPGGSFTQTFTANPAGVHWYHSRKLDQLSFQQWGLQI